MRICYWASQILISGFIRMQMSEHHLTEFISLYEKHFGIVLDRQTALEKGLQLCRFIEIVVHESPEEVEYGNQTKINHRL